MATQFCQKCKQSHPGRACDYDEQGECAEIPKIDEAAEPSAKREETRRVKTDDFGLTTHRQIASEMGNRLVRPRAVIFDDEDLFRKALWIFFDQRGYEVLSFPNPDVCPLHVASECLCPLGTSCSDIIISDVNMPGKSGIDFIEGLLQKGCRQRHFALMSGAFTDADRVRAARLGCAAFEKPVDMEALTAWVESVEKSIPAERILFNWTEVD